MAEEVKIANWELRQFDGEAEPRISEDELARRLGCERRSVRRTIKRLVDGGIINDSNKYTEVCESRGPGRKTTETIWLDEFGAIQVALDSKGEPARKLRSDVVQVYIDYRKNHLVRVEAPTPTSNLDLIERNLKNMVQLVGEVRVSRKIAEEALAQAEVNTQQIAELGSELSTLAQRRQAALDSIPTLPPAQGDVAERTTRSNIVELLRWAAIHTETEYRAVALKVHREFTRRYKIDFLVRAKNESKRTKKQISGLEMVERANECQRFYDLAVTLFDRPDTPLPSTKGQAA